MSLGKISYDAFSVGKAVLQIKVMDVDDIANEEINRPFVECQRRGELDGIAGGQQFCFQFFEDDTFAETGRCYWPLTSTAIYDFVLTKYICCAVILLYDVIHKRIWFNNYTW